MKAVLKAIFFIEFLILFTSCNTENSTNSDKVNSESNEKMFEFVGSAESGILFSNFLEEGPNTNILMYEYFYNGGGVVTADFNLDGLDDVFFTSNMNACKLYLNKGNFSFRDVTKEAKVEGRDGPWKTGATVVDINGDGLLDIYLSYSGALPAEKRKNQLFVNKGNNEEGIPIFEDEGEKFGLDHNGYSNQAYFFDFDKDNILEVLILNHNPKNLPLLNEAGTSALFAEDNTEMGLRYLVMESGKYVDKTKSVGINGSVLSYGLGLGIGDFNADGWFDFYVSNDYVVPDYVYINDKGRGFRNEIEAYIGHSSQFSMGNDVVDLNNDGLDDIITLDMLPRDEKRQKLLMAPDNYNKYEQNKRSGFHDQLMRNMLQMNMGNGRFSEVGQMAGISNTDWSWAPLVADFNNDGNKDIYITNGYLRDYTNLDFINYMENYVSEKGRLQRDDLQQIIENMPASDLVNFMYQNDGNGKFIDVTASLGLDMPSNSNGAAYADLDNDGDLDIIVNNINKEAFIIKNLHKEKEKSAYIKVKLTGKESNTLGLGAKVIVTANGKKQAITQMPTRSYLSSMSPLLHFGLGDQKVDSIEVFWNSGKYQVLNAPEKNRSHDFKEIEATVTKEYKSLNQQPIFKSIPKQITFTHQQATVNDYNRQPLLFTSPSYFGPELFSTELTGDQSSEIIVGGGIGQATTVLQRNASGKWNPIISSVLQEDASYADGGIVAGHFNDDAFIDLYVCSGGYHNLKPSDPLLKDRIYIGNGKGGFEKTAFDDADPIDNQTVCVLDINGDGKDDILTFARCEPGRFPESNIGKLYVNQGGGVFKNEFNQYFPNWDKDQNITKILVHDLNKDGIKEVIMVGLWTMPMIFEIRNNKFVDVTDGHFEDQPLSGLWNTIAVGDLNNDGIDDLILGNHGINSQLKADKNLTVDLYYKDFDGNGSVDPILTYFNEKRQYIFASRDELMGQLPKLKRRFNTYALYANAGFEQVMTNDLLDGSKRKSANTLHSLILLSNSDSKKYKAINLPDAAQSAPIYVILPKDVDDDGNLDLLLFGNNDKIKLRLGKMDSNQGLYLKGLGNGKFTSQSQMASGLKVIGDVRGGIFIDKILYLGINGKPIESYESK